MKALFLDIDGVLNSNFWNETHQMEISNGILVDEEKVNLLSKILRTTEAKIIFHSGWKYWYDVDLHPLRYEAENLLNILEKYGLEIYDKTPDLATDEIKINKKFSLIKAAEILSWLQVHNDVNSYIVLDDLDLHNDVILQHQVKTDSLVGLSEENVIQAIDMLLN